MHTSLGLDMSPIPAPRFAAHQSPDHSMSDSPFGASNKAAAQRRASPRNATDEALVAVLTAAESSTAKVPVNMFARPSQASLAEPHTLTSLIAKISTLQEQVRVIEADKVTLEEQRDFARNECKRASSLLESVVAEHAQVKARVEALANFREQHVCAASDEQYQVLEAKAKEARSVTLRLRHKEEHVNAILAATRDEAAAVRQLKLAGVGSELSVTTGPPGSMMPGDAGNESVTYEQLLLFKTGEQEVSLDRLRRAAADRDRLEAEIARNDQEIKGLRSLLENAGAPIPEAPQTHRTRRLLNRMSLRTTNTSGAQLATDVSTASWGSSSPSRRVTASSAVRVISVPVGTLRAIAARSGFSNIRALAVAHGVTKLAVKVHEKGDTELHCEGPTLALDGLETAVHNCISHNDAASRREGILTLTDTGSELAIARAVEELKDVLLAPKAAPRIVQFNDPSVRSEGTESSD